MSFEFINKANILIEKTLNLSEEDISINALDFVKKIKMR